MVFWCTPKSISQYGIQKSAGHKKKCPVYCWRIAAFGCAPKRSQSPPQSIDLWKKFGHKKKQKCNLYCILPDRHHRLRTKATPESTAKYRSLKNVWTKKNHKNATYIVFCRTMKTLPNGIHFYSRTSNCLIAIQHPRCWGYIIYYI